jgi:hypothetical protein
MSRNTISFEMGFKNLEWRYNFYITEDSPRAIADRYANPLDLDTRDFKNALMNFHGNGVELVSVSVADEENPGQGRSRKRFIHQTNPTGHGSTANKVTDVTANSMLSSMFGSSIAKRKFTMSGLPDAMIERNPDGSALRTAMFDDAWGILRPQMLAQGFEIRVSGEVDDEDKLRVRVMQPASVVIGEAAVEDASHTLFTTVGDHGLAVGDEVDFFHREVTRSTEELGGTFQITEIPDTDQFVLATRVNFRGPQYLPKELFCGEVSYTTEEITSWEFDDWGSRARGEGGGPRGRARSKRKKIA